MKSLKWYKEHSLRVSPYTELLPQKVLEQSIESSAQIVLEIDRYIRDELYKGTVPSDSSFSGHIFIQPLGKRKNSLACKLITLGNDYVVCIPYARLVAAYQLAQLFSYRWEGLRDRGDEAKYTRVISAFTKFSMHHAHLGDARGSLPEAEELITHVSEVFFTGEGSSAQLFLGTGGEDFFWKGWTAAKSLISTAVSNGAVAEDDQQFRKAVILFLSLIRFPVMHEVAHHYMRHNGERRDIEDALGESAGKLDGPSCFEAAVALRLEKSEGREEAMGFARNMRHNNEMAADQFASVLIDAALLGRLREPDCEQGGAYDNDAFYISLLINYALIAFSESVAGGMSYDLGSPRISVGGDDYYPRADLRLGVLKRYLAKDRGHDGHANLEKWYVRTVDAAAKALQWDAIRLLAGVVPGMRVTDPEEIDHYYQSLAFMREGAWSDLKRGRTVGTRQGSSGS